MTEAVERPKLSDYINTREINQLRRLEDAKSITLLISDWAVILFLICAISYYPQFLTFLLGALLIAGRQMALAVLMHEAAHSLLLRNKTLRV